MCIRSRVTSFFFWGSGMSIQTGRFTAPIAIGLFALVVACGGEKKADTTLAADTALPPALDSHGPPSEQKPCLGHKYQLSRC